MADRRRVIVGITGASGTILGVRLLEILRDVPDVETHLVMSPAAVRTLLIETDHTADDVTRLADVVHSFKDIGASIASGSFKAEGMIIAPCSVKTLGAIAHCLSDDLIGRAADVCLKERRRVVLLFRETPLHAGHIAAMELVTRAGAIVMPAVVGLYYRPQDVMEMIDHLAGRALDLIGIESGAVVRWQGQKGRPDDVG
ncbi:UbiX family flavin prenyltransferase [Roseitranquillus sediminis]|uniref:UbiX family flavin prenyltransferase n=1 Tax=Roseitranquillus sediminis TaxID=2809051 RepID=UPI001D0C626E|nr:UbiX family flavin prenyltransferase [Roseitranquillus sediminis]MBM9593183.1 UbiX family flavin prenyltransferase [Roseitranquillus sediminis]